MIRKSISLLLATLVLFNIFGYYLLFQCEQIRVKKGMNEMIANGALRASCEEITILNPATDHDFIMLDKGEIRYHGKLYDVISTRVSGTSVILRCINDTREEKLLARYEKFSTRISAMNLPEKSRNSQAMLYHIIKHALLNKYSVQPPSASFIAVCFKPIRDFNSLAIEPNFPPPKIS